MTNDDFFQENKPEEVTTEVEKIKVGENEYTQDELDSLVGLGKTAKELEEKWNTKIDRVYPEFTKARQELSEYRKEKEEAERIKQADRERQIAQGDATLTPDEIRERALREADQLGLVHKGNVRDQVLQVIQAMELNKELDKTVVEMAEKGLPKISGDELLSHMEETGIKNPEKAYKDMFEEQYITYQTNQLKQASKPGLVTDSTSTAGGKEPTSVKVTRDNLTELLAARLRA